jgi:hypothetical protein
MTTTTNKYNSLIFYELANFNSQQSLCVGCRPVDAFETDKEWKKVGISGWRLSGRNDEKVTVAISRTNTILTRTIFPYLRSINRVTNSVLNVLSSENLLHRAFNLQLFYCEKTVHKTVVGY